MKVKSLQKQLFAAIIMVVVATIALTSSTFAWFATNTRVTADTMSVTAKTADPFLQIKSGSEEYSTATHFTATGTELKLVAPKTITPTLAWYEAKSDDPNQAVTAVSATTEQEVTDGTAAYMVKQEMTIKNASNIKAENLEVSVALTGKTASTLDDSLRVLVKAGDKYALFDSTGALITTAPADASAVALKAELAANEELNVVAYMYYDGTDATAKNVTAVSTTAVTAELTFTIKGDSANSATA
jgi:hypothetical protein